MGDVVNLYEVATERDPADPPEFRGGMARLGPRLGAKALGATVYDLDPGHSICPYHYENVEEEWLLVLDGTPVLRDPEGEHELAVGDLVHFPVGPDGAHKVTNRSDAPVRVAMFSTVPAVSICVYPDSDKVLVNPPGKVFRLADAVDYFAGEV
ncbi:MAG: cupin domain-containing protein [Actinobacteria bacterium]|nr:cupin domain-containing protein [Actinomycetota bacterium]MBV8599538.1 cupin domain-containing protein [Actinomycetota bacterium]